MKFLGSSFVSITDEDLKKMARIVWKVIIGENVGTGFFLDLLNNGKVFNYFISNQQVIEDKDIEEKKD